MMEAFKIDTNKPLVCQVSRFDPWKDPKGVIDAYRIAKKKIPELQLALVGSMANDDPEGQEIYRDVEAYTRRDKDIHLLTNLTGVGELEVNAFQAYSDVIIQKSIREGFGLTVTEGMWKGKPVIGGNVGGIKIQIKDGENGYLVDTDEECAERMLQLLKQPKTREEMGKRAKKTATENFLHPRLIRDHLRLYHKLLKI
jgi:trehalose synthase